MGQKAHLGFLLFLIFFLLVITGPTVLETTRREEELFSNSAILDQFVKFMPFSENTNIYYKLDKAPFFLNTFNQSRYFGLKKKGKNVWNSNKIK